MNFKDLENAVIGETILVGENGIERIFMGFIPNKNRIIVLSYGEYASSWIENDIKDWKIKQPERETIQLYDTIDSFGHYCLCNENGCPPDFYRKTFFDVANSKIRKRNIIEPSIKIYKDSFEIVRE